MTEELLEQIKERAMTRTIDAWESGTIVALCNELLGVKRKLAKMREQTQEDFITYCDGMDDNIITQLCQIVCDNHRKFF